MDYTTTIFSDGDLVVFLEEMVNQLNAKQKAWSIRGTDWYKQGKYAVARLCDDRANEAAEQLYATRQYLNQNGA